MAWNSGFWNAIKNNAGKYDRTYNGDNYSEALSFVVGNGVIGTDGATGLQVVKYNVATSGYTVTIRAGQGWINGKWFKNDIDDNTSIANIPVTTAGKKRYDYIGVRRNNLVSTGRTILPFVTKGEEIADGTPVEPARVTNDSTYEIILARVLVDYTGSTPTISIYDTRGIDKYCGWVNGYFGDNFSNLVAQAKAQVDAISDNWRENTSVTKTIKFENNTTVLAAGSTFAIGIPEYNLESDVLEVYTNGIRESLDVDYSISADGSSITFLNGTKTVGTALTFVAWKSVDGTGLVEAVTLLSEVEGKVSKIEDFINEFNYQCTGTNDNIAISNKVKELLNSDATAYRHFKINISGTLGISKAANGTGADNNAYKWFDFATETTSQNRVILDFANCESVKINIANSTNNIPFLLGTNEVEIRNLTLYAQNVNATVQGVNGTGNLVFDGCKFWISSNSDITFATHGTFRNCRIACYSSTGNIYMFNPTTTSLIKIIDCELYPQTGTSGLIATAVYHGTAVATAVTILDRVRVPATSSGSRFQTNALRINSGYCNCRDLITSLAVSTAAAATTSITGTIPIDR